MLTELYPPRKTEADLLGQPLIISSGLCSILTIYYAIYTFCPSLFFCSYITPHLREIFIISPLSSLHGFFSHLTHKLAEHLIAWLLARNQPV